VNRIRVIFYVFMAVAAIALFAQPASAARETHVSFDKGTNTLSYSITGGDAVTYQVHFITSGCVSAAVDSADLIGPNDTGQVVLSCLTSDASGQVLVQFCEGIICFDTHTLNFKCTDDCTILDLPRVPTSSNWGLIILISLLILSAFVVIRHRKVTSRI